jgi:hypothetical protein
MKGSSALRTSWVVSPPPRSRGAERWPCLRFEAAAMRNEFDRGGPVFHLLLRYMQALISQVAQTAVWNRHYWIDQQLRRWLLLSLDGPDLVMTQELIANMLGVRREGVTEGALKLQKLGFIRYSGAESMCWTGQGLNSAPANVTKSSKRKFSIVAAQAGVLTALDLLK